MTVGMTAKECWDDFVAHSGVSHQSSDLRKQISEYVGVAPNSVYRWVVGKNEPFGEHRLRIMHFLTRQGYRIEELEHLPSDIRRLSEIFADRRTTLEEACAVLDYRGRHASSQLFRLFRGGPQLSHIKTRRLRAFLEGFPETEVLPKNPRVIHGEEELSSTALPTHPLSEPDQGDVVRKLVLLISAAAPLARALNSDDFSASDRSRLRHQVGEDAFFHFSNIVNALCGERARALYLRGQPAPATPNTNHEGR